MRAIIEILYQKRICILHRRNFTVRLPPLQTVDICADASIRILDSGKLQSNTFQSLITATPLSLLYRL